MPKITRREAIRTLGAGAGMLAAGGFFPKLLDAASATGETKRPNILFIFTDQQHARMMSCAGDRWVRTPAMDYIAAHGIRFERAYCANPVCQPSRTSMATGLMPGRLGVHFNGYGTTLPPEIQNNSLGELMKRAGYDTFYGGKVHMDKRLGPQNGSYDVFCADERHRLPVECLKFMTKGRDRPFFAVASLINPHDICFAHRARARGRSRVMDLYKEAEALPDAKLPPLPDNYGIPSDEPAALADNLSTKACTPPGTMRKEYSRRDWRIYRWIYRRLTEKVDKQIGVMLDGLKKAGLEENTVVIFTSDHGDMDASHRLASKCFFYEESVGVPLIVTRKGATPGDKVDSQHLVSTGLDILPTLCDYAGVEAPDYLLGRSLRPLAEGLGVKDWRNYVASEINDRRMIRSDRFKYCVYGNPTKAEGLYDLKDDPGELRNLAADPDHRQTLARHRELLKKWSAVSKDKSWS